jgi:hypothetical protein
VALPLGQEMWMSIDPGVPVAELDTGPELLVELPDAEAAPLIVKSRLLSEPVQSRSNETGPPQSKFSV